VRRRDPRRRSGLRSSTYGAALLEVLVALTILVTAATTIVAFAAETGRALARAREVEHELRRANALYDAVALWPRADLDQHLGDRAQGPWRMRVDRPAPTLYTVVLTDSARRREILRTALHRPTLTDPQSRGADSAR
jgi:type II secretory pathway pseudopilin PulG